MKVKMIKSCPVDVDLTMGKVYDCIKIDRQGDAILSADDIGCKNILLSGQYEIIEDTKTDPTVQTVVDAFLRRSAVGIEKYGTTLHENNLSVLEWLNHAQEEAMDFCLYLQRLKDEIKKLKEL